MLDARSREFCLLSSSLLLTGLSLESCVDAQSRTSFEIRSVSPAVRFCKLAISTRTDATGSVADVAPVLCASFFG